MPISGKPEIGGGRSVFAAMVRDASLHDAPHHEVLEPADAGRLRSVDRLNTSSDGASTDDASTDDANDGGASIGDANSDGASIGGANSAGANDAAT